MIQTFNQLIQKTIFLQGEKSQQKGCSYSLRWGYQTYTHFSGDRQLYDSFEKVVLTEGKTLRAKIKEHMTDYVKVHGEGNPSYESTKWSRSCTLTIGTTWGMGTLLTWMFNWWFSIKALQILFKNWLKNSGKRSFQLRKRNRLLSKFQEHSKLSSYNML